VQSLFTIPDARRQLKQEATHLLTEEIGNICEVLHQHFRVFDALDVRGKFTNLDRVDKVRPRRMAGQLWAVDLGGEVVVIFAQGLLGSEGKIHARDRNHPFRPRQARSLDGGFSSTIEPFNGEIPGGETLSADEHVVEERRVQENILRGRDLKVMDLPINFLDPETIVMAARTGIRGGAISWLYVSRDRARSLEWSVRNRRNGLTRHICAHRYCSAGPA
jgi:hypothetical protein